MKKLHSDFTFGFEFEGFGRVNKYLSEGPCYYIEKSSRYEDEDEDYDNEDYDYEDEMESSPYSCYDDWDDLECNPLNMDDFRHIKSSFFDNVNRKINNFFNTYRGSTHHDGSVKNYKDGYQSFEYASPIFKYTPLNVLKVKKFLKSLKSFDFAVNDTCGFHTHISYKGINEIDVLWILCFIASNEDYIKEFNTLFVNGERIEFSNPRYANTLFLYDINKSLQEKNYSTLCDLLTTSKYRVLRIHPQGTLEWRGPRNFINVDDGVEKYFEKLYKIIDIMCQALNTKKIFGLSRHELFSNISSKSIIHYKTKEFTPNSKLLKRFNTYGILTDFVNEKFDKSFGKSLDNLSNILNFIKKNPLELCNENYEPILQYILTHLSTSEIEEMIKTIKNKNKDIPLILQRGLVNNNSYMIKYVDKKYFSSLHNGQINNIISNIGSLDDEIVDNILKNCDYGSLIHVCKQFLTRNIKFINNILEIIPYRKNDSWSDFNYYDLYIEYCYLYDLQSIKAINSILEKEQLKFKLFELMDKNIIPNTKETFENQSNILYLKTNDWTINGNVYYTLSDICNSVNGVYF